MRNVLLASLTALLFAACVSSEPGVDPEDDDSSGGDTSSAGVGATAGVGVAGVAGVGGAGTAGSQGTAGAGVAGTGTAGAGTSGAAGAGTSGAAGAGTSGAAGTGTSGAAGTGTAGAGTAGSGGGAPMSAYGHGFQSSYLTTADETTAYNAWKSAKLKTCSNGELRVDNDNGETVSEGIGYGMLLAVGNNDQATFDGLWKYYSARKNGNGLMNWKYSGCGTGATGQNGASDGDLDTAMALLQAAKKWGGGYQGNATTLISAIKAHEVQSNTLLPGDMGFNLPCVNYSYFAPGYYRVFATVTGDSSWTTLANNSYSLINGAANGTTGLVPDWQSSCPSSSSNKGNYYYDAARTPWRIAVDYVWWGTPEAATWLTKVSNFVGSNLSTVKDGYHLDGTPLSSTGPNSSFVGAFACGSMAINQTSADNGAFSLKLIQPTATGESGYYEITLRAVYMLLLTGNFVRTT